MSETPPVDPSQELEVHGSAPRSVETLCRKYGFNTHVNKLGGSEVYAINANIEALDNQRETLGGYQVVAVSAIRSKNPKYEELCHPDIKKVARNEEEKKKKDPGFNTTSHLILASLFLEKENTSAMQDVLSRIQSFLIDSNKEQLSEEDFETVEPLITAKIQGLSQMMHQAQAQGCSVDRVGEDCIITMSDGTWFSPLRAGEDLSAEIYTTLMKKRGKKVANVSLSQEDVTRIIGDNTTAKELDETIEMRSVVRMMIKEEMKRKYEQAKAEGAEIFIVSGYVPMLANNRGYTDTTGITFADAIQDAEVRPVFHKIQDCPLTSASPSIIDDPIMVEHCSHETARELMDERGADSPIIEPKAMIEAQNAEIPILVYSNNDPDPTRVSLIDKKGSTRKGIFFVDRREKATHFEIHAEGEVMSLPGLESIISNVFADQGLSIHHLGSSANRITYIINKELSPKERAKLEANLKSVLGTEKDITTKYEPVDTVFCKGDNISPLGTGAQVKAAMSQAGIGIKFTTQPNEDRSLVFCVRGATKEEVDEGREPSRIAVRAIYEEIHSRTPAEFLAAAFSHKVEAVVLEEERRSLVRKLYRSSGAETVDEFIGKVEEILALSVEDILFEDSQNAQMIRSVLAMGRAASREKFLAFLRADLDGIEAEEESAEIDGDGSS